MILSMTGFGRGTAVRNGREITVELRSVNSRYFEYSSRMPRTCSYLDSRLKKQLNERVTRGKVELSLTVQTVDAADTVVAVNQELAKSYQQALRDLSETLEVKNDVTAGMIARFPDVLTTRHADVDEEQLWEDVSAVTAQALDRFVEMRAAEGAKMKADVENRLRFLEECVGRVVAVVSPESAPVKRLVKEARERGMLIDASYGRSTRAVLIMDSDHVVLSALQPETVASRAAGQAEGKTVTEEEQ